MLKVIDKLVVLTLQKSERKEEWYGKNGNC